MFLQESRNYNLEGGEGVEGRRRIRKEKVMGCLSCCRAKSLNLRPSSLKNKNEQEIRASLSSFVKNSSFRTVSGRQRNLTDEILKFGNGNVKAQIFTFRELAAATKNFRAECLVGEGGFGRVYKGRIDNLGQDVAVKQLDRNGLQGNREFIVEVMMLSLLHNPNLVNLVGFCADGDQRILVYEYMPLGSLEDHLLDIVPGNTPLDWHTRMKIAVGAAKGLEYLHDKANPPVIYRDFKASNILLDEDYNPKLSDFGLAKMGPTGDKSHVSTRVMGTYGYCAPEYAMTGKLTTMSDVYSFGVVFLEIITGRRAIDTSKPTDEQNLVTWAKPLFKDKERFTIMADPLLKGKFPVKGLYQALAIAAMCLQDEAGTRPLITDVVTALEYLAVSKGSGQISYIGPPNRLSGDLESDIRVHGDDDGGDDGYYGDEGHEIVASVHEL